MDTPDALTLIILALATARLTILLTRDTILEPLRHVLFAFFPPKDSQRHGWEYQCWFKATTDEREQRKAYGWPWPDRWFIQDDEPIREPSFIGSLASCPDCMSIWVAAGVAVAWWAEPTITLTISIPLALAMITSWIARRGGYA